MQSLASSVRGARGDGLQSSWKVATCVVGVKPAPQPGAELRSGCKSPNGDLRGVCGTSTMLCMAWRGRSGCWMAGGLACTALLVCALAGAAESGPDAKHKADVGPPPTIRIDVTSLGFIPPSRFYLSARMSSVTLDFIDKDHLLFTFRKSGLVPRLPDEPKDDEDRIICAVVLDAGNGKVVERAEWR